LSQGELMELLAYVIGVGVVFFLLRNRSRIEKIPFWRLLVAAVYALFAGWCVAAMQVFRPNDLRIYLEKGCYAVSALILGAWCWACLLRRTKNGAD